MYYINNKKYEDEFINVSLLGDGGFAKVYKV